MRVKSYITGMYILPRLHNSHSVKTLDFYTCSGTFSQIIRLLFPFVYNKLFKSFIVMTSLCFSVYTIAIRLLLNRLSSERFSSYKNTALRNAKPYFSRHPLQAISFKIS